jgi:Tfp pilus assembly protein PilV
MRRRDRVRVRQGTAVVSRRGFSLVEVIVALLILEVALLGVVASGIYALQLQRGAEARERALAAAAMVLDSLLSRDSISSGAVGGGDADVRWSVAEARLLVSVRYWGSTGPDSVRFDLPIWSAQ